MPTYDYKCDNCGYEWQREQRMSDKPIKTCPKCKKRKARRMISMGAGFILKGGGWYSDLYSKPGGGGGDSSGDSGGGDSGGGSDD